MNIKKLTKKQYLGEGYIHVFIHNVTKEKLFVPCTEEEYRSLGLVDGIKNNPTKEGYTFDHSEGGTIKVDNPDTVLKEGEYTDFGDGYLGVLSKDNKTYHVIFQKGEIVDNNFDMDNLKIKK